MPFHTEQLRLSGMGEAELQEASAAAQAVVGLSTYLHAIGYDVQKFRQELAAAVEHIKACAGQRWGKLCWTTVGHRLAANLQYQFFAFAALLS
jgi:predicted xylose isomerase-like sugar epimerase